MSNQLILTVGLPHSGKTAWAMAQGTVVVSMGSLYRLIRPVYSVKPLAKTFVTSLFMAGYSAVIIDDGNWLKRSRQFWQASDWETCVYRISGPEHVGEILTRLDQTAKTPEEYARKSKQVQDAAAAWEEIGSYELSYHLRS